ncbi:MAG: S-layer homology domain-containing protein, partial [Ruminococcaceae bacterium]|nr:S-layer homology domain-containing protein [Oscillospiraceae bacterium]
MSKVKKAVSFAVVMMMLISMFVPVSAFKVAEDVKGTEFESTAAILGALSIMVGDAQTGNFRPEDEILRSEVATVAVRTLGLDNLAASFANKKVFNDVVEGHWGNGYINVAASQKLVVGDDGIHFRPDDPITVEEAAVIFTKLLGYENKAQTNGGFPTGYMITANSIGLFDGIKNTEGNASRGMIAHMAENALEIKMMEQTGFGSIPTFEVVDKTILNDVLNVTKEYGQITANMFTRLNGASSSLKNDQVEINETIYTDLTGTATSLLGYDVMYLHRNNKSTGNKEILLALPDKSSMSELTIEGENVVAITGDTIRKVEYWENKDTDKKTQNVSISEKAVMIYNGVTTAFDSTLMKPATGTISGIIHLIDSDKDDIYDVVNVASYENYVVEEISTVSYKIFDKYEKNPLTLDPEDKTIKFTLTKDGANYKFEDLKEWDVLSVAKSLDGRALHVMVSQHSVEGTVTELSKNYVYIDGEKFKVADNYTKTIQLDDQGVFYLDHYNRIAAVDNKTRFADQYAYLYDAYATTSGRSATFSLLTASGEKVELTAAEKMTLNNQSGMKPSEILTQILDGEGKVKAQMVTYETNEAGQLRVLSTAQDLTDGSINDKVFGQNAVLTEAEYRANVNKLGKYNVSESTIACCNQSAFIITNGHIIHSVVKYQRRFIGSSFQRKGKRISKS